MSDEPELGYLDLADAILRGVPVDDERESAWLRERHTIELGTFEGMIGELLVVDNFDPEQGDLAHANFFRKPPQPTETAFW